ncbi:hypothetical protein BV20DRAFT_1057091 [Pilatotrama ljubarskyi]|nr:hypothetical protein BV20DRAFT_1057091 [Pilatotrama ljubarskyi]
MRIEVDAATMAVMETIFSGGKGQRAPLKWSDFVTAMTELGFWYTTAKGKGQHKAKGNGSKRVFVPDGAPSRPSFTWHEPHGKQKGNNSLGPDAMSRLRKILSRNYGWDANTFVPK